MHYGSFQGDLPVARHAYLPGTCAVSQIDIKMEPLCDATQTAGLFARLRRTFSLDVAVYMRLKIAYFSFACSRLDLDAHCRYGRHVIAVVILPIVRLRDSLPRMQSCRVGYGWPDGEAAAQTSELHRMSRAER